MEKIKPQQKLSFTQAERHEIYKAVREKFPVEFKEVTGAGVHWGLCDSLHKHIMDLIGWEELFNLKYSLADVFPEFWEQKPPQTDKYSYWWTRRTLNTRLKVLDRCIKKTI